MSNLAEYADVVDTSLHSRVFLNDPKLMDGNVYVNRDFSSILQQLYIVKNWKRLSQRITPDELWAYLKLHEYRPSKLVFDGETGDLIADTSSQDLYKRFYYNSLWLIDDDDDNNNTNKPDARNYLNISTLIIIVVFLVILFFITNTWQQEANGGTNNILQFLKASTVAQQWKN